MSNVSHEPAFQSALVECERAGLVECGSRETAHISEFYGYNYWNLRFELGDPIARGRVADRLQVVPPCKTNDVTIGNRVALLAIGPNECLLVDTGGADSRIPDVLKGNVDSIVEVSGGYTTIDIVGADATTVLSKGCTLDFHSSEFPLQSCAQSLVAQANVIIWYYDDFPTYRLIVRRTFAEYLWLWLVDALRYLTDTPD